MPLTPPIPRGGVTAPLSLSSGTLVASAPIFNLSQTWNNPAIVFVGKLTNVTDLASAAASLIEDWQVNGGTVMCIRKDGVLFANGFKPLFTNSQYDTNCQVAGNLGLADATLLCWSSTAIPGASPDTGMIRLSPSFIKATDAGAGVAFFQAKLTTDVNAVTGLVAGTLAATTNAYIVLYDASGQAYRIPCII